jgi:hypothetical protein
VRSALELPCPEVEGSPCPDVVLLDDEGAVAEVARSAAVPASSSSFSFRSLEDGTQYLRWPRSFDFVVSGDGTKIIGRHLGPESSEAFQTYLLSQVMSIALLLQGVDPLHATVVVVEGKGICFAAPPGSGKSTIASAFLRAGHRLLTDDLLVVDVGTGRAIGQPGIPRIKLFADSAARALQVESVFEPMNRYSSKAIYRLPVDLFHSEPVELAAMFVLGNDSGSDGIGFQRTLGMGAFLALAENTFNTMYRPPNRLGQHLKSLAAITTALPIIHTTYPRDYALLPKVVDAFVQRTFD